MPVSLRCSVIVPVHEDAAGALRCLEALRGQDLPAEEFEVLFCDNASLRDPLVASAVAAASLPRVQVLTTPEPGSYRARNGGLRVASGRVLAFTDADCVPARDWLSSGLRQMEEGALDICAGRVAVTTRERPSAVELYEKRNAFPQQKYVSTMSFGVTANLFVRRSVFDAVGPFSESLMSGGDRELCQRAVRGGARIGYSDGAWVAHPARTSVREVAVKAKRVLQGARDMGDPPPSRGRWLRSARPPLGALRRSRGMGSPRDRAMYVVGELQTHYIRWWMTREVARG